MTRPIIEVHPVTQTSEKTAKSRTFCTNPSSESLRILVINLQIVGHLLFIYSMFRILLKFREPLIEVDEIATNTTKRCDVMREDIENHQNVALI